MSARPLLVCAVLAVLDPADTACAQFTDPRTYENTPVGTNQVELGYAYARANTSIDTSLVVAGAQFVLHQGTVGYTRYFGWLHRLMWVEAAVPFANLGGSISGTNFHGSIAGAGDSSYAVSMLLNGGPALGEAQFQHYTPRTTLGVSVAVTAPTGSYDSARLLNLGADRWSFKPEIGLSHPFGPDHKWVLDVYGNLYWYTDNTSYRGREVLRQEPLVGLEGHISYSFSDRIWTSFDARYSGRGATAIDGVNQDNPQRNFVVGSETNISLSASSSLIVEFGKAVVHRNGPAVAGVAVKYHYTWARAVREPNAAKPSQESWAVSTRRSPSSGRSTLRRTTATRETPRGADARARRPSFRPARGTRRRRHPRVRRTRSPAWPQTSGSRRHSVSGSGSNNGSFRTESSSTELLCSNRRNRTGLAGQVEAPEALQKVRRRRTGVVTTNRSCYATCCARGGRS